MPLRLTLDLSGGYPTCVDKAEAHYAFSLHILCQTSLGQLVVLHNVLERLKFRCQGEELNVY